MDSIRNGHRERLRSRYLYSGENGLPDYDMLELLLTYAIQRRDVKPVARELMERFHNLCGVLDAGPDELCKVPGIGKNSALLISLIRTLCTRYLQNNLSGKSVLSNPEAVRNYVRMRLLMYENEVFLLIYLDVRHQIIKTEIFDRGTVDTIVLHPKMIAEEALIHKAADLIVAHNHPAGTMAPSASDRDFTRKLQRSLEFLEIHLLDHLIVSRSGIYSFLDHNLLEERYDYRYRK